jgi:hypothetical protein
MIKRAIVLVECVKAVLDGTCQCKPYESFAGNANCARSEWQAWHLVLRIYN